MLPRIRNLFNSVGNLETDLLMLVSVTENWPLTVFINLSVKFYVKKYMIYWLAN